MNIFDIQYALMAIVPSTDDKLDIRHFCGYEELPTAEEIERLRKELKTDPEFGLIDVDFVLTFAPPEVINFYIEMIQEKNEAGS
jgi:hypothetical protein